MKKLLLLLLVPILTAILLYAHFSSQEYNVLLITLDTLRADRKPNFTMERQRAMAYSSDSSGASSRRGYLVSFLPDLARLATF